MRNNKRIQRTLVVSILMLGALPGLMHVFAFRADAPLKRPEMAMAISATLKSLMALAPWPSSNARVLREDDAFFPLGRYAIPSRELKPTKRIDVELRTGALGMPCHERDETVVCGSAE